MLKQAFALGLWVGALTCVPATLRCQDQLASSETSRAAARTFSCERSKSLGAWTITGHATLDATKNRENQSGSLKVGPGAKALHNDREVTAVDPGKTGLKGFPAVAVWGDDGQVEAQTIWLADVSVTLGGPVNLPPQPKPIHTGRPAMR